MNKTWRIVLQALSYVISLLLVASIFGLDYYVKLISRKINEKHKTQ